MNLNELGLTPETFQMNLEVNRIASFADWPFDNEDCECTSKKLAEAGFYHIPTDKEPDLVRCYVCLKELEGWEPEDDPKKEHKKHAPKCPFVKLNKKEEDLKIEDLIKMEVERQKAIIEKAYNMQIDKFRAEADKTRDNLEELMLA